MHDLTGFQRNLLYVITGLEDPRGLALKDELEADSQIARYRKTRKKVVVDPKLLPPVLIEE